MPSIPSPRPPHERLDTGVVGRRRGRLVGWAGARSHGGRFAADGAALLRRLAASLHNSEEERTALRRELRRLTAWAEGADAVTGGTRFAPRVRLLARTVHDVGALERVLALGPTRG